MTGKIHVSPHDLQNVKALAETIGVKVVKETTLGRDIVLEIKFKDVTNVFSLGYNSALKAVQPKKETPKPNGGK